MSIFNSLFSLPFSSRKKAAKIFKREPAEIQLRVLKYLIRKGTKTKWGRLYGYSNIKTLAQFQERVPIQSYEDLQPYIERMQKKEKSILWPGKIIGFARSSGTTGAKSKFIPITRDSLKKCHYRCGTDLLASYIEKNKDSSLFSGKILTLGGTREKNDNDIYVGDISAILMSNLPFWTYFSRTPELNIALLGEWEEKLNKIIDYSSKQNITCLMGVPSWMIVLLYRLLEKSGKKNILEIWPNLELFIHGGISFEPYREQFKKIIPSDKVKYLEVYNASEGFFAMNENPGDSDMLLALDYGIFYEFIAFEDLDNEKPKVISLANVEINKNYALVISTNGGLWRYLIGDTVIFTNLNPPKIKISGRTKHFINAFGEELMVGNADKALEVACLKTGAEIREYSAAPVYIEEKKSGRHQWLIEFSKAPEDLNIFSQILDTTLKSLNSDYEAKRHKDISLGFPELIAVREGLFYDWLKNKNKLGGQNKVPRLANNREYVEELLKLV